MTSPGSCNSNRTPNCATPTASPPPRLGGIRIAGTGIALPERKLSNADIAKLVDTSDAWIRQRTGIETRHVVAQGQTTRELASAALRQALERAGMAPTELDLVIVATMTPDMACPATAARVVAEVGATPAGALDISIACSGFVYAMNHASALIASGFYKTVAVIGAESMSRITNFADRRTCILFGDAASCAILTSKGASADQGCVHQTMNSDGRIWDELYVPLSAADLPAGGDPAVFNGKFGTLQMDGQEVFKFAVTTTQKAIEDTLAAAGVKAEDLAMLVPHQSNFRILDLIRTRLNLPKDRIHVNIDRYGNTSAASVGLCLHELMESRKLKKGDLVLFAAIGGGMAWTTNLWKM